MSQHYTSTPPTTWSDEDIRDYYYTTNVLLSSLASMTGKSISKLKEILTT